MLTFSLVQELIPPQAEILIISFKLSKMSFKPALLCFKLKKFQFNRSFQWDSEETDCNGNHWYMYMIPPSQNSPSEWTTLIIESDNKHAIDAKFSLCIRDNDGNIFHEVEYDYTFYEDGINTLVDKKFILASEFRNAADKIVNDEILEVNVVIQVKTPEKDLYQPMNNHAASMLRLLESGDKSDVKFNVGRKVFRAHSQILYANAPILANFCEQQNGTDSAVIKDTSPDIFKHILNYVYGAIVPTPQGVCHLLLPPSYPRNS
jgi:hypothetical protein